MGGLEPFCWPGQLCCYITPGQSHRERHACSFPIGADGGLLVPWCHILLSLGQTRRSVGLLRCWFYEVLFNQGTRLESLLRDWPG